MNIPDSVGICDGAAIKEKHALPTKYVWLGQLADCVAVSPLKYISATLDLNRGELDSTPLPACRKWSRGEKAPSGPPRFYFSRKLTSGWRKSIIVEGERTGGYPSDSPGMRGEVKEKPPLQSPDWIGDVPIYREKQEFT